MEYNLLVNAKRWETIKEDMELERNKVYDLKESGSTLQAIYSLSAHYETANKLTDKQLFDLDNAMQSLILLKGEEAIDERIIVKFIQKSLGIKIINLNVSKATKQYSASYRGGWRYFSKVVDLLQKTETKNV